MFPKLAVTKTLSNVLLIVDIRHIKMEHERSVKCCFKKPGSIMLKIVLLL